MTNLSNTPKEEMGVPLGGTFGRLLSPAEAQELVRRDKAEQQKAARELQAKEKKELRLWKQKQLQEENEFNRSFSNKSSSVEKPPFLLQVSCFVICLFTVLLFLAFGSVLNQLAI